MVKDVVIIRCQARCFGLAEERGTPSGLGSRAAVQRVVHRGDDLVDFNLPVVIRVAGAARGNRRSPEGNVHAGDDFVDFNVTACAAIADTRSGCEGWSWRRRRRESRGGGVARCRRTKSRRVKLVRTDRTVCSTQPRSAIPPLVDVPHRSGPAHCFVTGVDRWTTGPQRNGLRRSAVVSQTSGRKHRVGCRPNTAATIRVQVVTAIGQGVASAIAARGAVGNNRVGDRQRALAVDAAAAIGDAIGDPISDDEGLDREIDLTAHGEDAHGVPAADRDQIPAIDGGVSGDGLGARAGADVDRHGKRPAIEGHQPAAAESGIERRVGATSGRTATYHTSRPRHVLASDQQHT